MLLLLPPFLSLTIFLLSFLGSPRWCCSFGWWSCGCGAEHRRENRMMMGGGSKYPFTASQWQELELQALMFKYMVSGIPVPPDLILCIRKSLFMDPHTLPFLSHPPPIGWETYQLGDGRKSVDPEPGRCRRTDGKKWRCSKEAYPDSKYCERHMHRGKSRSRKPVELSLATNPTSSHFPSSNLPPPPRSRPQSHHFLSPCSSSSRPPAMGHSRQDDSAVDNYRNLVGFKEDVHEYRFFSEPCRGVREIPCRFGPVDVSSVEETKQRYGYMQSTDPHFRICLSEEQEKEKNCFEIGADFKTQRAATLGREEQPQNVRPFHCFLDEKPPKMEESWMSMDGDQSKQVSDLKTRLSISIPATASQRYNDG